MRNDSLMNGGLIGFGLGFLLASLALYRVASQVVPEYAMTWHLKGVAIVGGAGLVLGIVFEVLQRIRMKRRLSEPSE